MQKISSITQLRDEIQLLEVEQAYKGQQLKEQFHITIESLKPVNLIKSTFKEISISPALGDNVLGIIMGLTSGYLSKKMVVGTSGNVVRKLIGNFLQVGVASVVARHPNAIKMIAKYVIEHFPRRKEKNLE